MTVGILRSANEHLHPQMSKNDVESRIQNINYLSKVKDGIRAYEVKSLQR